MLKKSEITKIINKRMEQCEKQYDIKVLYWYFVGSVDIGIYRKNSDLDLIFVFKNKSEKKCSAIHDIIGYGLDFWGWDIDQVLMTIERNTQIYYQNPDLDSSPWLISKEHARAGLDYFYGIYYAIGNNSTSDSEFLKSNERLLWSLCEIKVLINHLLFELDKVIEKIDIFGKISSNEYLYTVWQILICKHVLSGGLPGENNMIVLLEKYTEKSIQSIVKELIDCYKNSLSKHSQIFNIPEINDFIINKIEWLSNERLKLEPKNNNSFVKNMKKMKGNILLY